MKRCKPCVTSHYPLAAVGGGGGLDFTEVTLEVASIKQDPNGAFNGSSTWGSTSQINLNNVDPGNINGALPDLALLEFLVADPFDYDANTQLILQYQFTGTPTSNWIMYLGLYDGTVATNHGLYGSLQTNNGGTGAQTMGANSTFGQAAASVQAAGGDLSVGFNLDAIVGTESARGNLVRSDSAPGPAYGRAGRADNRSAWGGTALYGFLGFGATGVRDAGTVANVKLRYLLIPRFS